jgi:hypothetical protein
MHQGERVVYKVFFSEGFVDKLVTFLSMEEVKGKDRFDVSKYTLFKVCSCLHVDSWSEYFSTEFVVQ